MSQTQRWVTVGVTLSKRLGMILGILIFVSGISSICFAEQQETPLHNAPYSGSSFNFSRAQLSVGSVRADTIPQVDAYLHAQLKEIKEKGFRVKHVDVIHTGPDNERLRAIIGILQAEKLASKNDMTLEIVRGVESEEFGSLIKDTEFQLDETQGLDQPISQNLIIHEKPTPIETYKFGYISPLRKISAHLRHFFGVPQGITWTSFLVERDTKTKLFELGFGVSKAAILTAFTYGVLSTQPELGALIPSLVGASFGVFFDYFQQGNFAFQTQGFYYDFKTSQFKTSTSFALMKQLFDSVMVRQTMKASAHVTGGGSYGIKEFADAFKTSAMGLFSRVPINLLIKKDQHKHPTRTKYLLAGSSLSFGFLQVLDLFKMGMPFRRMLAFFGASGLAVELYRSKDAIMSTLKDCVETIWPIKKQQSIWENPCATALRFEVEPIPVM